MYSKAVHMNIWKYYHLVWWVQNLVKQEYGEKSITKHTIFMFTSERRDSKGFGFLISAFLVYDNRSTNSIAIFTSLYGSFLPWTKVWGIKISKRGFGLSRDQSERKKNVIAALISVLICSHNEQNIMELDMPNHFHPSSPAFSTISILRRAAAN